MNRDIKNTLAGSSDLEKSRGDASQDDLERGYYDGAPKGDYEAGLETRTDGLNMGMYSFETKRATRHAGFIEADSTFKPKHGEDDEYGFVRRPTHKSDLEPN